MSKQICLALLTAVVLLGSSCPPQQGGGGNGGNTLAPQPWPEAYANSRNNSFDAVHTQFALAPLIKWTASVGEPVLASPVIGPDGVIWIGNAQGEIVGINPDGSEHRRRKLDDSAGSAPAINPDTNEIFVVGQHLNGDMTVSSHLFRLDAGAALLAVSSAPMLTSAAPKLFGNFVFQPSGERLYVLDQATLNVFAQADGNGCFNLVCGEGGALTNFLVCTVTLGTVQLAGLTQCAFRFVPSLAAIAPDPSVIIIDDPNIAGDSTKPIVVMLGSQCANGYRFDPTAASPLQPLWSKLLVPLDCDFQQVHSTSPVLLSTAASPSGVAVVFGIAAKRIFDDPQKFPVLALDPLTGDTVWHFDLDEPLAYPPVTVGLGQLSVATGSQLITLNSNGVLLDKKPLLTSIPSTETVPGAALSLDFLYVATDAGLYSFSPGGASTLDFSIAQGSSAGAASVAIAEDGTLYVSNAAGTLFAFSPQGRLFSAIAVPTITWQTPADGAAITSAQGKTLTAQVAGQGGGPEGTVTFTSNLDGPLCQNVTPSGGIATCTTTKALTIGAQTLTAFATNSSGGTSSAAITVQVTDTPPAVAITAPANNAVFQQGTSIAFTAQVSDPDQTSFASDKIQWVSSVDGNIGTGLSFTKTLSLGTHTVTATATDSSGQTGNASISIQVTKGPVVAIQQPTEGAILFSGSPITFSATVTDSTEPSFPASGIQWKSSLDGDLGTGASVVHALTNGNHTITVTATDTHGLGGQASVHVTVQAPVQ